MQQRGREADRQQNIGTYKHGPHHHVRLFFVLGETAAAHARNAIVDSARFRISSRAVLRLVRLNESR